jgi:hypothetical protein
LVNKLTARLSGLTAQWMIWRVYPTPAGRLLFRLSPWGPFTSDHESILLPTPTKRDGRTLRGSQPPKRNPAAGLPLAWFVAKLLNIFEGRLNPTKVGLLMGYPEKVTQLRPTAMPSSHKSPPSS